MIGPSTGTPAGGPPKGQANSHGEEEGESVGERNDSVHGAGDEGGGWEEELGSQRDTALAMARELSRQLDSQRETLERRARTAEELRNNTRRARDECLTNRTRRNQATEVHVRLAGLVGGSLSAWLMCVALGLVWAPRASLALGLPCTLVMAAVCSRRFPRSKTRRRTA